MIRKILLEKIRHLILTFSILLLPTATFAANEWQNSKYIQIANMMQCMNIAAIEYGLHPALLHAVWLTEGGWPNVVNKNKNGTYDMGPMQINSIWLKELSNFGIRKADVIRNACLNFKIGAWILRTEINNANNNIWEGVGNYHSRNPKQHFSYLRKVVENYRRVLPYYYQTQMLKNLGPYKENRYRRY